MSSPFRTDDEARNAIHQLAKSVGLNHTRIAVNTFAGGLNDLEDRVQIHFPGRRNGERCHADGTYEAILAAIRESTSFAELVDNCAKRDLLYLVGG